MIYPQPAAPMPMAAENVVAANFTKAVQPRPVHYLQANATFIFVYSTNQVIVEPTVIVLSSRLCPRSVIAVSAVTSHLVR
uniref:Uncharacterized protein n=1 Tax=Romanomermis culicivorax TaxID=13658 RepID=A0A915JC96_ROMCU